MLSKTGGVFNASLGEGVGTELVIDAVERKCVREPRHDERSPCVAPIFVVVRPLRLLRREFRDVLCASLAFAVFPMHEVAKADDTVT